MIDEHKFELPNDTLAEKSLLGCLLIDSKALDEISDLRIKPDHFYNPKYGIIFAAIKELSTRASAIDYVTICSILSDDGKLELIGGQTAIVELFDIHTSSANIYHYAKIVKDKSSIRELIKASIKSADIGRKFKGTADDYIAEIEKSIFDITNTAKTNSLTDIKECLKLTVTSLADKSNDGSSVYGISTGFKTLDRLLSGMQPGQLIVLASRPAMGKSALALNIALNTCEITKLPVAIFSLEMLKEELTIRLLSSKGKIDGKRMKNKELSQTEMKAMSTAVNDLASLPIKLNDAGDTTVLDIQSQCRKIKADQGLGLIVIDYLQLVKSSDSAKVREQQISEMSRGLKGLAQELKCPILALSQINRQVESRPNKRPVLADLRESGAIEQDADIVTFIYRDEVYNPDTKERGIAEIIVAKNRAGEVGTVKMGFNGPHVQFSEL